MKKMICLSLLAATCATITCLSLNKNSATQAAATDVTSYPTGYGTKRRLTVWSTEQSYGEPVFGTINKIKVSTGTDEVWVDAGTKHTKSDATGSYNDDARTNYFDIPAEAKTIVDLASDSRNSFSAIEGWGDIEKEIPNTWDVFVLDTIKGVDNFCIGYWIQKEGRWSDYSNNSKLDVLLATSLEGCYSCSNGSANGYGALDVINYLFAMYINFSDVCETFLGYVINDISGYEEKGVKTCTVEQKLEIMWPKWDPENYGSLAAFSANSVTNSYLWAIAIAGTAAIASIAAVVISTEKRKKRREN